MKSRFKEIVKNNKILHTNILKILYLKDKLCYKVCPEIIIKRRYKKAFGRDLNINNPKTFNEKIHYLNLYKIHEYASKCADKYEVREYIKSKGYEDLLVELLGVYDSVDEIDFEKLPKKFALKATHGSGYNIVTKDKNNLDIDEAKQKLNKWMKENFAIKTLEFHYNDIKPRIICEKYIDGFDGKLPIDYKVFCFNGNPKFTECCIGRDEELTMLFYDLDWNKIDCSTSRNKDLIDIDKPQNFNKMIEVAKDLSEPFDFVRVDFFESNGKLIIGELTFTPAGGKMKSMTEEADIEWGQMLNLNM